MPDCKVKSLWMPGNEDPLNCTYFTHQTLRCSEEERELDLIQGHLSCLILNHSYFCHGLGLHAFCAQYSNQGMLTNTTVHEYCSNFTHSTGFPQVHQIVQS